MDRRQGVVVRFHSNFVDVRDTENHKQYLCSLRGRFRLQGIRPITGDIVEFTLQDEQHGRIENILPRKNLLLRPNIANLDHVILVVTYRYPDLSALILDKFLLQTERASLDTTLVFNKSDLLSDHEINSMRELAAYYEQYYTVIETSAISGQGISDIQRVMAGRISTMAGMSGVGKSTLLNAIEPGLKLRTHELSSALDRGVHTTTYVELIQMGPSTFIADTPGFAQLEMKDIDPYQIRFFFPEMIDAGQRCLYADCSHLQEHECEVINRVRSGQIMMSRYESYRSIFEEAQEFQHQQQIKKEKALKRNR